MRTEPQTTRDDEVRETTETSRGETVFDERRCAVLDLLSLSLEEATVAGGNGDDNRLVAVLLRLIEHAGLAVMEVVAIVVGETMAAGGAAVEAVGAAPILSRGTRLSAAQLGHVTINASAGAVSISTSWL